MHMPGIAPKLPLSLDPSDINVYKATKTLPETIHQNLKMLVLTIPGERIMMPEYGVGIKKYLFENDTYDLRQSLRSKIEKQIQVYMPFISLSSVNINSSSNSISSTNHNEGVMNVSIIYSVPGFGGNAVLELSL